jgi:hypothetical protein
MIKKIYKVYADTSVYGGVFDDEFASDSKLFFEKISNGDFTLIIYSTVIYELEKAPQFVKEFLNEINTKNVLYFEINDSVINLRNEYIKQKVLGKGSIKDAEHIAMATIADADFIVSWNFKHIVHFDKIEKFQAVNILNGYKPIKIYSLKEVI